MRWKVVRHNHMTDSELVDEWEIRIKKIDSLVRPIAKAPVDLDKLDAFLASPPSPLDDAGCRSECESLVSEIVDHYINLNRQLKDRVQHLFDDNSSFSWAGSLPEAPLSDLEFERRLILFIIRDQSPDPRDAIMQLEALLDRAQSRDLNTRSVLKKLLPHANNQQKWGFPSTRNLLKSKG